MANLEKTNTDPEDQFWDQLDDVHAGMLGIEGSKLHMQPMGHQTDTKNKRLIFFTTRDAELTKNLKAGDKAHFCVTSKDQDYYTCMSGPIREERNEALIEKFWNPVIDAWFEGKHDPNMTLLIVDLENAKIWASTNNSIKFGWEILKANVKDTQPDVGITTDIIFRAAA